MSDNQPALTETLEVLEKLETAGKEMGMDSLLQMHTFNSLDWRTDETGLFANNIKTGERILLSRFVEGAKSGIQLVNDHMNKGNFV